MTKKLTILSAFKVFLKDPRLLFSLSGNLFKAAGLRVRCLFTGRKVYYISLIESLGDIVATEPVVRYLHEQDKKRLLVWVTQKPYREIPASNPNIKSVITVTCLTEWMILRSFCRKKRTADLHLCGKICNRHSYTLVKPNPFDITPENYFKKGNLLFAFSRSAGIEMNEHEPPKLHLDTNKPSLKPETYIVMHTSTNMPVKTLNDAVWQEVIAYVLNNFPKANIIETGFEKRYKGEDKRVIDFTGKKALAEIAGLVKHCRLFIGIDSSFAHFANALEADSLILMGQYENFLNYMPYSGFFESNRENMMLYYPGKLQEVPFDFIKEKLADKLSK